MSRVAILQRLATVASVRWDSGSGDSLGCAVLVPPLLAGRRVATAARWMMPASLLAVHSFGAEHAEECIMLFQSSFAR